MLKSLDINFVLRNILSFFTLQIRQIFLEGSELKAASNLLQSSRTMKCNFWRCKYHIPTLIKILLVSDGYKVQR